MLALIPVREPTCEFDLSRDRGTLVVAGFRFNTDGLDVVGQPNFDEWQFAMQVLGTVNHRIVKPFKLWCILMLLHGESHYGETYSQAMEQTGLSYSTLANAKSVIQKYAIPQQDGTYDTRGWHPRLSFEHHAIVAKFESDEREAWLQKAESEHLTTDELRAAVKPERGNSRHEFVCPQCGTKFETSSPVKVVKTLKIGKGVSR